MKTKIFVSSSSGIDQISHSPTISYIPLIIKFSEYEMLYDVKEISGDAFYQRMRIDKSANPICIIPTEEMILNEIKNQLENDYERFVFLIDKQDKEYIENVNKIKEKYKYDIEIIEVVKKSYPLAEIARFADRLIRAGEDINSVREKVTERQKNSKLFVCNPQNDLNKNITRNIIDEDIKTQKVGKIYEFTHLGMNVVKNDKNDIPVVQMLKAFLHEIDNKKVKIFIVYTNKYSAYLTYIIEKIRSYYPELKEIDRFSLPIELGIKFGNNSVGVGYISND